jgi:hypothetical protein
MSARPRQPSDDESKTEIFDSSRSKRATQKQGDVTGVTKVERRKAPTQQPKPEQPIPHSQPPAARDRSEPIRVISMKAATEEPVKAARPMPKVQIRSMADVSNRKATAPPIAMGYLAPPRDPKESRSRRRVDNVMWACFAVILACGVTLAIWFLAR